MRLRRTLAVVTIAVGLMAASPPVQADPPRRYAYTCRDSIFGSYQTNSYWGCIASGGRPLVNYYVGG
jgi:hypothetical protein